MQERLQKIIARAGIASRRHAEELISSGHVRVNGEVVTELGAKADPESDRVEVDGKLAERPEPAYYMLHKPVNVVSTMSDPEGRATLRHLLRGLSGGIFPVGRLDYATSGLLLLTSDGELANRIFKVSGNMPKVFWIKVKGRPSDDLLASLRHSAHAHLRLLDPPGAAKKDADNPWYEVEIGEARRDLLRRSLFAADHPVEKMKRVKIGPLDLGDLPEAHYRKLDPSEITRLRAAVERAELAPRPIRTGGKLVGPGNRRFKRLREAEKFQPASVRSGAQRPVEPPHEEAYTPAPTWTPPRTPDQPSTWQQPTSTNLSAGSSAATPWDRLNKPEESSAENSPSRPSNSTFRPPNISAAKGGASSSSRPPYKPSPGKTWRPPNKSGARPSGRPPYRSSSGSTFRPPNKGGSVSSGRPPYKPSGSSSFRPPNKSGGAPSGSPPYRPSGGSSFRPPNKGVAASSGRPPYKQGSSSFRPPNKSGASSSGRPPYRPSGGSSFRPPNKGGSSSSGRPPYKQGSSSFRPPNKSGAGSSGRPPYRPSRSSSFRPPNKSGGAPSGRPPYRPSGGSSFRPPNKGGAGSSGRPPRERSGSSFRPSNKPGGDQPGVRRTSQVRLRRGADRASRMRREPGRRKIQMTNSAEQCRIGKYSATVGSVQQPSDDKLREMLRNARTIAVVGLSSSRMRASFGVSQYMQSAGYRIIPVNPNEKEVLGEKAYSQLADVPEKIDIVNIFRRSEFVSDVVGAAIKIGAKAIWMQEGVEDEQAAARAAKAGLTVVMDRCILKEHRRLL